MTYTEYQQAKKRIKKLNRRLGQLNRNFIWNLAQIEQDTAELQSLQSQVSGYEKWQLPQAQEFRRILWAN